MSSDARKHGLRSTKLLRLAGRGVCVREEAAVMGLGEEMWAWSCASHVPCQEVSFPTGTSRKTLRVLSRTVAWEHAIDLT